MVACERKVCRIHASHDANERILAFICAFARFVIVTGYFEIAMDPTESHSVVSDRSQLLENEATY